MSEEIDNIRRQLEICQAQLLEVENLEEFLTDDMIEFRTELVDLGKLVEQLRSNMNRMGKIADKITASKGWNLTIKDKNLVSCIKQMKWRNHIWMMFHLGLRDKKGMR